MKLLCDECGWAYKKIFVEENVAGVYLGKFQALKCVKCAHVVFDMKTSLAMTKAAKEKGVFGISSKHSEIHV